MVLNIPNFLVKTVIYGWMGYLSFTYLNIYRLENQTKKLEAYKKNQLAMGNPVTIPDNLKEAQEYTDNHYGKRLLERIKTQHVLEEQVQHAISAKKDLREKLVKESNEEEVSKLELELSQLNELFTKIKSRNSESN